MQPDPARPEVMTASTTRTTAKTTRRPTQKERAAATRLRLLDATIDALVELGYRGTTTLEVQRRAGVSRGALLYHYTSRSELILAAIEHLGRSRLVVLQELARPPRGRTDRVAWAIRTLWGTVDDRLFQASLELWLAARSDDELRAVLVPQERWVGGAMRVWAADLFGSVSDHPRFEVVLEVLMDAMRGAAARSVLRSQRGEERLIAEWIRLAKLELES